MKENPRYAMSLTYGPREKLIFEEIDHLAEKQLLPKNTNEILRRGIYAVRYLAEIDEKPLLRLLSQHLHSATDTNNPEEIAIAKNLSFAIYSTMIAKDGILKAETFETIPMQLRLVEQVDRDKVKPEHITKGLEELATSLDTIFLEKPPLEHEIISVLQQVAANNKKIEKLLATSLDTIFLEKSQLKREIINGLHKVVVNNTEIARIVGAIMHERKKKSSPFVREEQIPATSPIEV